MSWSNLQWLSWRRKGILHCINTHYYSLLTLKMLIQGADVSSGYSGHIFGSNGFKGKRWEPFLEEILRLTKKVSWYFCIKLLISKLDANTSGLCNQDKQMLLHQHLIVSGSFILGENRSTFRWWSARRIHHSNNFIRNKISEYEMRAIIKILGHNQFIKFNVYF